MATFPSKVNYATGDILTATNMNDVGGAINLLQSAQTAAGKNAVINGAMDIWQRGTTFTNGGIYTADRWYFDISAGTVTSARESTIVPAGFQYSWKITKSAGSSSATAIQQTIETSNAIQFAGKSVVLSAYFAADASTLFSPVLEYSTAADNPRSGSWTGITPTVDGATTVTSTTFVRVSSTFAIPSTAKTLRINYGPTVAASSSIYITGVQLEATTTVSVFQRAAGNIAGELAACQRYYLKSYAQATAPATATNTVGAFAFAAVNSTATDNRANVRFPVNMRGTPTITVYSSSTGTSAKIYNENTTLDLGGAAQFIGESGFHGYVSSGVITGAGTVLIFHYVASAEL